MFKSQKHVFWQALIVTVFIFGTGVLSGVILENWRTSKISDIYEQSEINLLDIRIQNEIYSGGKFDCNNAAQENLVFADKIYSEAKELERYEEARRITSGLILQHKKYDLLREMLFLNSIEMREVCKLPYDIIVYFYIPNYEEPSFEIKARQKVFSKLLEELKQKKGNKILLIPIAVNKDLSSINLLLHNYNISKDELPVILINEKTKITNLETTEQISKYLQ